MKHSLLHIALVSSFIFTDFRSISPSSIWNFFFNDHQEKLLEEMEEEDCPETDLTTFLSPIAQEVDSLALVDISNASNGFTWMPFGARWNFNTPVCTWFGVTLDAEGYVIELKLNGNNLSGTLHPSIGNLSRLEFLNLGDNVITGPIPASIGGCTNLKTMYLNDNFSPSSGFSGAIPSTIGDLTSLETLFLDGNRLSDTIPKEIGSMSQLRTLYLDENELVGTVPNTLLNLANQLIICDLFTNNLDSIPDFSSMSLMLQNNKFDIRDNRLTFDDILPNINNSTEYHPQDSFFQESTVNLLTGQTYRIELGIDSGIEDNNYRWFKDNTFYPPVINTNYLDLSPVNFSDAGTYCCQVTNPNAPLLTLYSRCITINVSCGGSVEDFNPTLCTGQRVTVNGKMYGEFPLPSSGTELLTDKTDQYGCDSTVVVDLSFTEPVEMDTTQTLCPGGSVMINGTVYDENNPDGTETVDGGPGCDTTLNVEIFFYTLVAGSVSPTICETDTIFVNGNAYYKGNETGEEELLGGSLLTGCDSMVNINLTFFAAAVDTFNQTLCSGAGILVNGNVYNEGNPSGDELIESASPNGCDSLIHIDLSFGAFSESDVDVELCFGDSIEINGTFYGPDNPSGTDTIMLASGCDSLIHITATSLAENNVVFAPFLCAGDTVCINGVCYGQSPTYPSNGVETLTAANGCDSTVQIFLNFFPAISPGSETITLCPGQSIMIEGSSYGAGFPLSGNRIVPNVAANGCDSTYNFNINFHPPAMGNVAATICAGTTFRYNEKDWPASGQDTLDITSFNGCDSIVNINISFYTPTPGTLDTFACAGEGIVFEGTLFNAANPTGSVTVDNNGCDSTIVVTLDFYDAPAIGTYSETHCPGGSFSYNGTTIDVSNSPQTLNAPVQSFNGCDSMVLVSINFSISPDPEDVFATICPGTSIVIEGQPFDESNPQDTIDLGPIAIGGCDSAIHVLVDFYDVVIGSYSETVCEGGSFEYNGTTINAANPTQVLNATEQTSNGCDSLVEVSILFHPASTLGNYSETVCEGGSFEYNGTTINAANPTQVLNAPEQTSNGCDSLVEVSILFHPASTLGNYSETVCEGGSFEYNGTSINAANPTQVLNAPEQTSNGCDSLVEVSILFHPVSALGSYSQTVCEGGSFEYNSVTFDVSNQSGNVLATETDINGCDSMVAVSINFFNVIPGSFTPILCNEDSITIGDVVYHLGNPSGTSLLPLASQNGCDSMVNVQVAFYPEVVNTIDQTLCEGTTITVNGVEYGEAPLPSSGVEIIPNGSFLGCDSTINITLAFNTFVENNVNETICGCDTMMYNGVIYDCFNPTGQETLIGASYIGCDSIININLTYIDDIESTFETTFCPGESIVINGTIYSETLTTGTETFINGSTTGCDSIVDITLNYHPAVVHEINRTLCDGESVTINGVVYNTNTNTTDVVPSGASTGCDSSIVINITVLAPVTSTLTRTLCNGQELMVGDSTFNELHPNGIVVLEDESVNGCDSTVTVNLSFNTFVENNINGPFCIGESIMVQGVEYNEANPIGSANFPNQSIAGCDSIVNINLIFLPNAVNNIIESYCPGESLMVGDSLFNQANPDGIVILENASAQGCDSTVNVNLTFSNAIETNLSPTLCLDESIEVDGEIFDVSNPVGTKTLSSMGSDCDSIVTVNLSFHIEASSLLMPTLCEGGSIEINGVIYDSTNMTGMSTIENGSANGCDSTVSVQLSFFPPTVSSFSTELCSGSSLMVGDSLFDESHPAGPVIFTNGSANGCDSTVSVQLNFFPAAVSNFSTELCSGNSLMVGDSLFDESHPAGPVIFTNGSANGCDSTVSVQLSFFPPAISNFNTELCNGGSLMVGDSLFDESHPAGPVIFTNGSVNGCDSTVMVTINFSDAITNNLTSVICAGDVVTINNVDYNSTGVFTETIPGGSFLGCDSIIVLDLKVEDALSLGLADAGMDQSICSGDVNLSANQPDDTFGAWTTTGSATIAQEFENETNITNLSAGNNLFIWTLSTDICANYDSDTVMVNLGLTSISATDDEYELEENMTIIEMDILSNDALNGIPNWTVEILSEPTAGTLTELSPGVYQLETPEDYLGGDLEFGYQICDLDCPNNCTEANATIFIEEIIEEEDLTIPSGITPNGDGLNETLVIPEILNNPDKYSEAELTIFNRWGEVLYNAQPYTNDWDGSNNKGKPLPQGTYYYVLTVDLVGGIIYKGDVTILK